MIQVTLAQISLASRGHAALQPAENRRHSVLLDLMLEKLLLARLLFRIGLGEEVDDRFFEQLKADWLAEVSVHPGFEAFLAVAGDGARCERNDGRLADARSGILSNEASCLVAVDDRL